MIKYHSRQNKITVHDARNLGILNTEFYMNVFLRGRGTLMHGLQGAEAQGPTLERGPTGCKEIQFFE